MPTTIDRLTLVALAAFAYVLATALHEHGGHALACVLLGSRPSALGAFYVSCEDARLAGWAIRAVALAGPVMSLLTGVICFSLMGRLADRPGALFYFLWLLGTVGLLSAAGYPLFSGFSGVGDLGLTADGALSGAEPEWLWRVALIVLGVVAYIAAVRVSLRRIVPALPGSGGERREIGRKLALWSYCTGVAVCGAIGLLNPIGIEIVVGSALAATAGGTSGLLWMMRRFNPERSTARAPLAIPRDWHWIVAALIFVVYYAAIFGPTWKPMH